MNTSKLGICLDHSSAHLIEFVVEPMETKTILSSFTHEKKEVKISKSENVMHHAEQHENAAYYKKLGSIIIKFKDVVLFGPTTAKQELYNMLKADHLFDHVNLQVKHSDKMSANEQHAFVRDYFKTHLIDFKAGAFN